MTTFLSSASFAPEQVIHVKVETNPKKPSGKSYARFALYEDGMTVEQYVQRSVDAGNKETVAIADLRWDVQHKFIEVSKATEVDTVPATEANARGEVQAPRLSPED